MGDPADASTQVLAFGPFRLLPAQRMLLEGNAPVRLGSRALDILIALVERPGEVVSKEELVTRAWPNIFVEETNLRVHVGALRKVLGHGQSVGGYVANVPGRGYSFVAPVTREGPPAAHGPARERLYNLPPTLTRTIWRTVWFEKLVGITPRGGCGLAVQVLIQDCAIAGMVARTPKIAIAIARKTARFENIFPSTQPYPAID